MKTCFLLFLFSTIAAISFGQSKNDSVKIVRRTFTDYDDLRRQNQNDKITGIYMVDSTLGYKVMVPDWLKVRETGSEYAWGGTLPPVNGVENAIMIKAYPKKDFADMKAFEDFVIGDWAYGTHPKWSADHICYGKKEIDPVMGVGKAYRASSVFDHHIYTCKYVLAVTRTAYLWIDFTSIPALYDVNLPRFDEFLKGVRIW